MQQNARVIILTLDAARAAGLELARPLDALEAAAAATTTLQRPRLRAPGQLPRAAPSSASGFLSPT